MRQTFKVQNFRYCVLLAVAFLTSACGPLIELPGGETPARLFELRPALNPGVVADKSDHVLLIEDVIVPGALKGQDIAVRVDEMELAYLPGMKWAHRLQNMQQTYLQQALKNQLGVPVIGPTEMATSHDKRLLVEVRDFSLKAVGKEFLSANIAFSVTLFSVTDNRLMGQRDFVSTIKTTTIQPEQAVKGFEAAQADFMCQLTDWLSGMVS